LSVRFPGLLPAWRMKPGTWRGTTRMWRLTCVDPEPWERRRLRTSFPDRMCGPRCAWSGRTS